MKKVLTIIFLFALNYAQGQQYFQRRFNLNPYSNFRQEHFNSGIRTLDNRDANNAFFYVGIGTSYLNDLLPSPHNLADRVRFTRMNQAGSAVLNNRAYHFLYNQKILNSYGHSITEIKTSAGDGGYLAVGRVANNKKTGGIVGGESDILLTRFSPTGAVLWARNIDLGLNHDEGLYIKRSVTLVNNLPTWIICGSTRRGSYTDAVVARVNINGAVIWLRRYNFDPGGAPFTSAHNDARQFTEDAAGNIYVVGTLRDNVGNNGNDGLAFKLNPGGFVLWSATYHHYSDDQFQAVRLTPDGHLIVGGFTNAGGAYNMQIAKLHSFNGNIIFRNILRAGAGGTIFPSKAYDIEVVPGPRYYLAGVVYNFQGAPRREMLYQTTANGQAVNWNSYNPMLFDTGFGLDYLPGACPGLAYFASMRNLSNPNFSDGHIMKTGLDTKTCKFLEPKTRNQATSWLTKTDRRHVVRTGFRMTNLTWAYFGSSSLPICYITCPTGADASADPEESMSSDAAAAEQSLGERAVEQARLVVGPNPVRSNLHLAAHGLAAGEYQVQVFSAQGQLVQHKTLVATESSLSADLDLSAEAPGVYLVVVSQGAVVLKQRILKQ